jgi:hypothetical protein
MEKVDGSDADTTEWIKLGSSWIQTTHLGVPTSPERLLSSKMDAIPRGLDQVDNVLP